MEGYTGDEEERCTSNLHISLKKVNKEYDSGLKSPKEEGSVWLASNPWVLDTLLNTAENLEFKKNKSKQKKYRHSAEIDEDAQTKITNKEKDIGWNPNKL